MQEVVFTARPRSLNCAKPQSFTRLESPLREGAAPPGVPSESAGLLHSSGPCGAPQDELPLRIQRAHYHLAPQRPHGVKSLANVFFVLGSTAAGAELRA